MEGREIVTYGDGKQMRVFAHVGCIVEWLMLAEKVPVRGGMNLDGGNRLSFADSGATLTWADIGRTSERVVYQSPRHGEVGDCLSDVFNATAAFSYSSRADLRIGLAQHLAWLREADVTIATHGGTL